MTLYETIFARRQVRSFTKEKIHSQVLDQIWQCIQNADPLYGQHATFEILPAEKMAGNPKAPYYLLSFCPANSAAFANVGYLLQKADLYIQSIGLGSGWFMSPKPKATGANFCIALAFGKTNVPIRKSIDEFKRKSIDTICPMDDSSVADAVRLAPSSLNSQPWKVCLEPGKVVVQDAGKGIARFFLKNKLNKIDVGIAARHAVIALEEEHNRITRILPRESEKSFEVEILYTKK